jgi:hypothetical protein
MRYCSSKVYFVASIKIPPYSEALCLKAPHNSSAVIGELSSVSSSHWMQEKKPTS